MTEIEDENARKMENEIPYFLLTLKKQKRFGSRIIKFGERFRHHFLDIFEKITAKLKFQQEDWVQITVLAVRDIECLGSGMLGIWDFGEVEYFGCGILGIWDAFDMEYLGYEMFGMWKIFYVGWLRCGIFL